MLDNSRSYVNFIRMLIDEDGTDSSVDITEYGWDKRWSEYIQPFINFLRACGYNFTDQQFVDAVNEEYGNNASA